MSAPGSAGPLVVGYDGSPASGRALAFAIELARSTDTALYLVHARDRDPERAEPSTEEESTTVDDAIAAAVAGWADRAKAVRVRFLPIVREPPAARAIVDVAREVDARLIVVGTRGLHSLSKAFLGSVSGQVLETAHRPVLVVP